MSASTNPDGPRCAPAKPSSRSIILAYLEVKLAQADAAVEKAQRANKYHPTVQTAGQYRYWTNVAAGIKWAISGVGAKPKVTHDSPDQG